MTKKYDRPRGRLPLRRDRSPLELRSSPHTSIMESAPVNCPEQGVTGSRQHHGRNKSSLNEALRVRRAKPAFRKVILDGDRRSDGRYLEISATPVQKVQHWTGGGHRPMVLVVSLGNALYPCARALFWTEQVQKPGRDLVELGQLSESPAFRLEHEIGASGKRSTISEGEMRRGQSLVRWFRNRGQCVF